MIPVTYWVSILADNGTELYNFPVVAIEEMGALRVSRTYTEQPFLDILYQNRGKQLKWEKAFEEIETPKLTEG